eukprot:CAMPEP_0195521518 /NCGR_PEP_ID=MMETSP0794_2-20130614/18856_1 /TAXON_ID=515487 /ORGANISM="Stephanopyxis turris, Strain CCMP 815" /LENGTH=69 /DNA_ID=CAMNT_0040651093 /DNA_START=100 /DNA_END=309 /DNA_ORIENTATION=+
MMSIGEEEEAVTRGNREGHHERGATADGVSPINNGRIALPKCLICLGVILVASIAVLMTLVIQLIMERV